jgi:vanillate O-demethylase monooxygenase subunit
MGAFLQNAWYVAAWGDEIGRKPMGRTLLQKPIVFYRKADGEPVALDDRCPHRFVPLSGGKLAGDDIQCPYHGLTFSAAGMCTDARTTDLQRERPVLRPYPLVERYGAVWIWMGEADRADPALIPVFRFFDSPTHILAGVGYTHINASYTLEIDNLLDLSHLDYVHPTTLSNGEIVGGEFKVYQRNDTVHSDWWVPNSPAPGQFRPLIALHKDPVWDQAKKDLVVDFWLDMRWDAPGTLFLDVGVGPAGANRAAPIDMPTAHFVTPETESTTHYFWAYGNTAVGQSKDYLDGFLAVVKKAFGEEDRPILEAQQRAMKSSDFWAEKPLVLAEDAGAIRARRLLDRLIREEAESQPRSDQTLAAE